jgi:hypothetical protein
MHGRGPGMSPVSLPQKTKVACLGHASGRGAPGPPALPFYVPGDFMHQSLGGNDGDDANHRQQFAERESVSPGFPSVLSVGMISEP